MPTPYFCKGVYTSSEYLNEYRETIEKFIIGNYSGLQYELIHTDPILADIRVNEKIRLFLVPCSKKLVEEYNLSDRIDITTLGQNPREIPYLVVTAMLDHKYQRATFLKSGVLKEYLKNLPLEATEIWLSKEELINEFTEEPNEHPVQQLPIRNYQNQLVYLTNAQQLAIETKLPAIVTGLPGTGKSLICSSVIEDYFLNNPIDPLTGEKSKIMYLTTSQNLADNFKANWNTLFPESNDDDVEFLTYAEFLNRFEPEKNLVNDDYFNDWFKSFLKNEKRLARSNPEKYPFNLDDFENLTQIIYQELKIAAGYNLDDYLKLGNKQSLFSSKNEDESEKIKTWIFNVLEMYSVYLNANLKLDTNLHYIDVDLYYSLIVVDEAQGLPLPAFKILNNISNNILYCLDVRQDISSYITNFDFIQTKTYNGEINHVDLDHSTFRCAKKIAYLSKKLLDLKYKIVGGVSHKVEQQQPTQEDQNLPIGEVEWLNNEIDKVINEVIENPSIIVITNFIEEAKEKFNTVNVLTPEEARGNEWDTVIAYRVFENSTLQEANKLAETIKEYTIETQYSPSPNRPKDNKYSNLNPALHQLFVTFTRAKNKLIIYQPDNRHVNYLTSYLKGALELFDQSLALEEQKVETVSIEAQINTIKDEHADDISDAKKIEPTLDVKDDDVKEIKGVPEHKSQPIDGKSEQTYNPSFYAPVNSTHKIQAERKSPPIKNRKTLTFPPLLYPKNFNKKPIIDKGNDEFGAFKEFLIRNNEIHIDRLLLVPPQTLHSQIYTNFYQYVLESALGYIYLVSLCLENSNFLDKFLKFLTKESKSNKFPLWEQTLLNENGLKLITFLLIVKPELKEQITTNHLLMKIIYDGKEVRLIDAIFYIYEKIPNIFAQKNPIGAPHEMKVIEDVRFAFITYLFKNNTEFLKQCDKAALDRGEHEVSLLFAHPEVLELNAEFKQYIFEILQANLASFRPQIWLKGANPELRQKQYTFLWFCMHSYDLLKQIYIDKVVEVPVKTWLIEINDGSSQYHKDSAFKMLIKNGANLRIFNDLIRNINTSEHFDVRLFNLSYLEGRNLLHYLVLSYKTLFMQLVIADPDLLIQIPLDYWFREVNINEVTIPPFIYNIFNSYQESAMLCLLHQESGHALLHCLMKINPDFIPYLHENNMLSYLADSQLCTARKQNPKTLFTKLLSKTYYGEEIIEASEKVPAYQEYSYNPEENDEFKDMGICNIS